MIYLSGLEPDFDIRQELKFIGTTLDLRQFNKIFISLSGGKDSHAMIFYVAEIARNQGCLDKLIAVYADTGMEWHNAESHCRKICAGCGVPLQVVYPVRPMLEKFKHRFELAKSGKINDLVFPSVSCRYCTSEQKVAPIEKFIRKHKGKLLQVTGERWHESSARANYNEFVRRRCIDTANRVVYGWRPMLQFRTEEIFAMVQQTGIARHCVYELGGSRLGCAGCIFSNDRELKIEMANNPAIFDALDRLEFESGRTMSIDKRMIRDRVKRG